MHPPAPPEPLKTKLLRLIWRLCRRRPRVDIFLTGLLRYRHYLPEVDAEAVIPDFDQTTIRIAHVPRGTWSTPLADLLVVLKAAAGFRSRRILELGSYQGHTARLLAENTSDETLICAVDVDPRHGRAYADTPLARRITRKTGAITRDLFGPEEKFDFIFVDADHDYEAVMNHTAVAFDLLAPGGVILWHDYQHTNYFHGMAGVPEALRYFSRDRAIVAVKHTIVALYSEFPGWKTADIRQKEGSAPPAGKSVWEETTMRG